MNLAHHLMSLVILAQNEGDGQGGGGDGGAMPSIFNSMLLPMVVIGIMFYFLFILPERKKRKELEDQLNTLKKNDAVVTSGGVCGVIVSANPGEKTVIVRIDDSNNTKIEVLRSHIAHVGRPDEPEKKKEAVKEKKDA